MKMEKQFSWYTILVTCTACFLATSVDIPLSWTSPIFPKISSNDTSINPIGRPITEDEDGWIGSLVTLGAIIGPFPFSVITGKFGRKIGLLSTAIPIIISFFTLAFAREIWLFYLGRILAGLSMGAGYALLPIYIAEISEDHNRGRLSQALNIFWSLGNFLCFALGPFVSIKVFNLILGCIPTIFFVLFLIIAPESPYHLVAEGKIDKAKKALLLLRPYASEKVENDINKIRDCLHKEETGTFLELFTNHAVRKALIICGVLIATQELCGFCAILFYMQTIFDAAGTELASDISSLIVAVFILSSSFINPFFVDRSGRRFLTIISCAGMCIALTLLGLYFYLHAHDWNLGSMQWLPLFSLILFIFSFNFGISSIPWTLTSELFPSNIKNMASNIISVICWGTSFLVTRSFNILNSAIGRYGTFWIFAGCCFLAAIFSILFVPETKGKSFNEIQEMLQSGRIIQLSFGKKASDQPPLEIRGLATLKVKEKSNNF